MEIEPTHPKPGNTDEGTVSPPTPVVYESEEYHWEYKQVKVNLAEEAPLQEARLNELGREGWELAAAFTVSSQTAHYYFKRPAVKN